MDPDCLRFLTSDDGARALAAAREARALPVHRRARALAGLGTAAEIRAALQQDDLRVRAAERCPHAEVLLFTPEGLEQATAWPVAAERATRWGRPDEALLTDLGAGIGFDALAAARAGRPVRAYERDATRAALLRHNARALGVEARLQVERDDILAARPGGPLAFFDPDRRPGGRRTRDPAAFDPPADTWSALLDRFDRGLVKLPPVVEGPLPLEGAQEVVSLAGRARERRLFVGAWEALPPRRALALPGGRHVEGRGRAVPPAVGAAAGCWLLDPDVSVTQAGLLGDLAARAGLAPQADGVAYLVGPAPEPEAPGHWIRVAAVLPAKPKALDAWLHAHDVGRLTVRTRGLDVQATAWRRRLHPRGAQAGTLVFTRDRDGRWIVYAGLDAEAEAARAD